jgi:hypothetical protein
MGEFYITRHGTLTAAVDLTNAINIETSGVGTSNITVPAGVTRLKRIIYTVGASAAVVASAGVNVVLRLSGLGVEGQPHDIVLGGTKAGATGTNDQIINSGVIETNLTLVATNPIVMEAFQKGVDAGSPSLTVTLNVE